MSMPKINTVATQLLPASNAVQCRVLSFNVNFGNFLEINTEAGQKVLDTIREIDADIVCLQESNANTELMCRQQFCKFIANTPHDLLAQQLQFIDTKVGSLYCSQATLDHIAASAANSTVIDPLVQYIDHANSLYPNQIFYTDHMYYGAGISVLTKQSWKLSQEHFYIPSVQGSYFPILVVKCTHVTSGRELIIGNVHLRPPLAFGHTSSVLDHVKAYFLETNTVRKNEMQTLLQKCTPHMICGDFNEGTWGGAWNLLRADDKYEDAPYQFEGNKRTWFWPVIGQNVGAVGFYDHIFYSKKQKIEAVKSNVVDKYVSDHYPVVADFKLL